MADANNVKSKPHKMSEPHRMHGPYKKVRMSGLWHILGTEDEDYDTIAAEVTVEDIADMLLQSLQNRNDTPAARRPLTATEKAQYLADPSSCPRCHSTNVECIDEDGYNADDSGTALAMEWRCCDCEQPWVETYKLINIE